MPRWSDEALVLGAVLLVLVLVVATLPWTIQTILRLMLAPRYRLKVTGRDAIPRSGPALIAANHVSWLDGFLLAAVIPRRGKALINAAYVNLPVVRWLAGRVGLIPVRLGGPKAMKAAIETARAALDRGEVVLIFPEAQLSRTGLTGPFLRGLELILSGREQVPVVPAFLDNLWCSIFSYCQGRFFWKRPRYLGRRRPVHIAFGPPVPPPVTTFAVRQAVIEAGVAAFALRQGPARPLETLDPTLPRLEHPGLGLLAASTPDANHGGIVQIGSKPGSVGQAVPGVALRVVDDTGRPLPPDTQGRLQALPAGSNGWTDTGLHARIDRDGFVQLV